MIECTKEMKERRHSKMLCTSCYNNGYMLYAISRVILFLSYQVSNQYLHLCDYQLSCPELGQILTDLLNF